MGARDWRRRPPLRLSAPRRLGICWCWVNCNNPACGRTAVVAIVPFVIRWGPDSWRGMLRQHGRCSRCGHKGATLQHPSWGGNDVGWAPMPINRMAPVPRIDV